MITKDNTPSSRATTVALLASLLSLIVTIVSLAAILFVATNLRGAENVPVPVEPSKTVSPVPTNPAQAQTAATKPAPVSANMGAPKEIADHARSVIEEVKCKDCQCADIQIVRAWPKPLTDADKQSQITDAWCFEIYYSKQVCKWQDMATTLSIRKVQGLLQAAEMGWGDFDKCLMPSQ